MTLLLVPCTVAAITAVWYGVGGFLNLLQLFRDLKLRVVNPLDNGRVEGNMSLADKAQLEKIDSADKAPEKPGEQKSAAAPSPVSDKPPRRRAGRLEISGPRWYSNQNSFFQGNKKVVPGGGRQS